MPEKEDRNAGREKGEKCGVGSGAGSAPGGKCTGVAGKTKLEAEQSCYHLGQSTGTHSR